MNYSKLFSTTLLFASCLFSQAQTGHILGVTRLGGADSVGTIFTTDSLGDNHKVVYDFKKKNFARRVTSLKLTEASNGELYGVASQGGPLGSGSIFRYDSISNEVFTSATFTSANNGYWRPVGELLAATNGKVYGYTTYKGGVKNGSIFEFDPITNVITHRASVDNSIFGSSSGHFLQANNGMIYTASEFSWSSPLDGVIYMFNPTTYSVSIVATFQKTTTGRFPYSKLIQASNGKIYGVTQSGGTNDHGVLFEFDPVTTNLTNLASFDESTTGSHPKHGVIQAPNGDLLGTTYYGGLHSLGTLFSYSFNTNKLILKHSFDTSIGMWTKSSLFVTSAGKILGLTEQGGRQAYGKLYEFDVTTNSITTLMEFNDDFGPSDIDSRGGSFFENSNGKIIFSIQNGIFEYDYASGIGSTKAAFNNSIYGDYPLCQVISSQGKIIGITEYGGTLGNGVIYELDPLTNSYTILRNLKERPMDTKISLNKNDQLLWATHYNICSFNLTTGIHDTIIRILPAMNNDAGYKLWANFEFLNSGSFYGVSQAGGDNVHYGWASGSGVLYKYDAALDTNIVLHTFDGAVGGRHPWGGVKIDSWGNLYGVTLRGGQNNAGLLYKFVPSSNLFIPLFHFDSVLTGANPNNIIIASNGTIYGSTFIGGLYDHGTLFQYEPTQSVLTKLIDFDGNNLGSQPNEDMAFNTDETMLIGSTKYGGTSNRGTYYEYDINASVITNKMNFSLTNYSQEPRISGVLSANINSINPLASQPKPMTIYPNPTKGDFIVEQKHKGTMHIEIMTVDGKLVFKTSTNNKSLNIHLLNHPNGTYLIKTTQGKHINIHKIVKY